MDRVEYFFAAVTLVGLALLWDLEPALWLH